MHIAIYSYKVGDRKQMERLMEREADRWIKEGNPIYTYTFGSVESLLASTLNYDAVLVDLCEIDTIDAAGILEEYKARKVKTRIVECADFRTKEDSPDYFFLQKAIKTSELHEVLTGIYELKIRDAAKIELRTENETIYVEEREIMYVLQNQHMMEVMLSDGRKVPVFGKTEVFYQEIESSNPTIILPAPGTLINIRYIDSLKVMKAVMTDGNSIRIRHGVKSYIKEVMELLKKDDEDAIKRLSEE